jgi:hypothetical protein
VSAGADTDNTPNSNAPTAGLGEDAENAPPADNLLGSNAPANNAENAPTADNALGSNPPDNSAEDSPNFDNSLGSNGATNSVRASPTSTLRGKPDTPVNSPTLDGAAAATSKLRPDRADGTAGDPENTPSNSPIEDSVLDSATNKVDANNKTDKRLVPGNTDNALQSHGNAGVSAEDQAKPPVDAPNNAGSTVTTTRPDKAARPGKGATQPKDASSNQQPETDAPTASDTTSADDTGNTATTAPADASQPAADKQTGSHDLQASASSRAEAHNGNDLQVSATSRAEAHIGHNEPAGKACLWPWQHCTVALLWPHALHQCRGQQLRSTEFGKPTCAHSAAAGLSQPDWQKAADQAVGKLCKNPSFTALAKSPQACKLWGDSEAVDFGVSPTHFASGANQFPMPLGADLPQSVYSRGGTSRALALVSPACSGRAVARAVFKATQQPAKSSRAAGIRFQPFTDASRINASPVVRCFLALDDTKEGLTETQRALTSKEDRCFVCSESDGCPSVLGSWFRDAFTLDVPGCQPDGSLPHPVYVQMAMSPGWKALVAKVEVCRDFSTGCFDPDYEAKKLQDATKCTAAAC